MRPNPRLLVSCLFLTGLAAQNNGLHLYPDFNGASTTFSTRSQSGAAAPAVELLQEYPARFFRGIGEDAVAGRCELWGWFVVVQDQNGLTREPFTLVMRREATGGGPDPTPTGMIASLPFTLPSGTGVVTQAFTLTAATAFRIPCEATIYSGVSLPANANWPADGLSQHAAAYVDGSRGDNPRTGTPNLAWRIEAGVVGLAPSPRVMNTSLVMRTPVLMVGNYDPGSTRSPGGISYGAGGLYPAFKTPPRDDGIEMRVNDFVANNGLTAFFASPTWAAVPIPVIGANLNIMLRLDPTNMIQLLNVPLVNGLSYVTAAAPGVVPSIPGLDLRFQAFVFSTSTLRMRSSNTTAISF